MRWRLVLALSIVAMKSTAGVHCVSTAQELQAALEAAQAGSEPTEIRMAAGIYAGSFIYATPAPGFLAPDIAITGDWNSSCLQQQDGTTRIDGDLTLSGSDRPQFGASIRRLDIGGDLKASNAGLLQAHDLRIDGRIWTACCIEELEIKRVSAIGGIVVSTGSIYGTGVHSITQSYLGGGLRWISAGTSGAVAIRNNTLAMSQENIGIGIDISYESVPFDFSNNLIVATEGWGQGGVRINLDGDGNFLDAPATVEGNWLLPATDRLTDDAPELFATPRNRIIDMDPPFEAADWRLIAGAPQINYAEPRPEDFAETDIEGNPRVVGGKIDVGAYESPVLLASGFEAQ